MRRVQPPRRRRVRSATAERPTDQLGPPPGADPRVPVRPAGALALQWTKRLVRMALGLDAVPVAHRRVGAAIKGDVCEMFGSRLIAHADGKASAALDLDVASAFQEDTALYRDQASALVRPRRGRRCRDKTGTAHQRERCDAAGPGVAKTHSATFRHAILAARCPASRQLSATSLPSVTGLRCVAWQKSLCEDREMNVVAVITYRARIEIRSEER